MQKRGRTRPRNSCVPLFALTLALLSPFVLSAQVMESASYKIQFDSINTGGLRSTSNSYVLEDTVGEIATGRSESASYRLRAGYQQMNEVFLSLSGAANVAMAPSIGGLTGGVANGQTSATATTDGVAGYELSLKASTSPALERNGGGSTITDYVPEGASPDFVFTVTAPNAEFGFSPEGNDIAQRFLDNGTDTCNTGATETADSCWDGLSTTNTVIAQRTSSNHPSGTQTVIKFRTEVGGTAHQLAGTYTATSTITLVAL